MCYLLQRIGTRKASLLITALVTLSAAARSFATTPESFAITTYTCMVVNGAGGVLSAAGIPLITSLWFKESERITATSIILVNTTFLVTQCFYISFFLHSLHRNP